ncbi:hypothetical protein HRbin02_01898 [Candidatus Calditenuaceae archaeon HR02]|nr:hypothetical protein HRbin02_01898 [Candidatus Calditenuaceae archaeon HR02]
MKSILGGYLIKLSTKMIQYCMDEIREVKDWWEICEILKKSIGSNMMKHRRKPTPASL